MATFFSAQVGQKILPGDPTGQVEVEKLTALFNSRSSTYKFFFCLSLLDVIDEGKDREKLSLILLKILAKAWYPLIKFNLSFGTWDSLKEMVAKLQDDPLIKSQGFNFESLSEQKLYQYLTKIYSAHPLLIKELKTLNRYVPTRFLSPWIGQNSNLAYDIFYDNALYGLFATPHDPILNYEVVINPNYLLYLRAHSKLIRNYTFYLLTTFLEKQNPQVPNIALKLIHPQSRESLTKETNFFKEFIENCQDFTCIYTKQKLLSQDKFALDHFIPWSFCFSNTIWNLTPIDASTNSQKSDYLPSLEEYLDPLCEQHYDLFHYHLEKKHLDLKATSKFSKFVDDYLQLGVSIEDLASLNKLDFAKCLNDHLAPAYQVAKNHGFKIWTKPIKVEYVRA